MANKSTNLNSLGSTAIWTAAARAYESKREERLFDDPWAAALAGPEGAVWAANRPADSLAPIILRIRFFDDFLQCVSRDNAIRQVVLMAAGLDTRAYRLPWPAGTSVFELDQPAVLQWKEQILHSAGAKTICARHSIAADLTGQWKEALIEAGFEPGKPSVLVVRRFLVLSPH